MSTKSTILLLLASSMMIWGISNRIIASQETFFVLEPSEDAYVSQLNSNSNYGHDEVMSVRSYRASTESWNHRTYMRFNLERLGQGRHVASATLRLYKYIEGGQIGVRKIEVKMVLGQWHETNITWENKPGLAEKPTGSAYINGAGNWYEWNVTVDVRSCIDEKLQNNGFCLLDSEEDSATDYASVFFSREAAEMYMYRPKLEVKLEFENVPGPASRMTPFLFLVFLTAGVILLITLKRLKDSRTGDRDQLPKTSLRLAVV